MSPDSTSISFADLRAENESLRAQIAQLRANNDAMRQSHAELCLADLRLRSLLDSGILGVLIGGADGTVVEVNGAFERIVGRAAGEGNALLWQRCVPPEEAALHLEKSRLLWSTGQCPPWETALLRPDGTRVPVMTGATLVDASSCNSDPCAVPDAACTALPVAAPFDAAISDSAPHSEAHCPEGRTMLMWILDISQQKSIENQMRAIVDSLHDGLLITDLDDTITYANARMSEMCGYSNDELLGHSAYRLLSATADLWEECEQRNIERAYGESGTYEIPIRCKDGSTAWVLINGSPMRDVEGNIIGTIGAHFDITERKNIEVEKARFQEKLESSNRDLEAFAYAVSHDLKEPLRKIEVFGSRLEAAERANLEPQSRDYLERMRAAARRMSGLIDGLLLYSRVASATEARREVDLNLVAREVSLDLELATERARARLEIGELPCLFADPTQMRQLLQNLIANALAYRRADVPLEVRVTGRIEQNLCVLEIADNGRGFEARDALRIFEIFQRLSPKPAPGESAILSAPLETGAGVGLTICRKIVERHGGTIKARGVPGQGTTFRIEIPVARGDERSRATRI